MSQHEYDDRACHVSKEAADDELRFVVDGEIDLANLPAVSRWVDTEIDHQHAQVRLCLEDLQYLDSAGISWLFHLARRLSSRSQKLCCDLPNDHPLGAVFHYVKLDRVIEINKSEPGR